jgi:two-component system cell cycle response regulator
MPQNEPKWGATASQPSILLAEDSATTATLLTKYLSDRYTLVQAHDGAQALAHVQQDRNVGLILTDINMPNMTGHQLLVEIRRSKDPDIKQLPVIVMTDADDNTDRNLAFMNGASDFINKPIDELELQARVNVHYTLANTIRELEASRQALHRQATTDPLTGLKNRREFFSHAEKCLERHRRYGATYSVIMLDIDYFKAINDSHGHDIGDKVLVAVSAILPQLTRNVDTVARVGGEEFAILLPDTKRLGAAVMAERIRSVIENHDFQIGGKRLKLTVSIGIASQDAEIVDNVGDLMRIADKRLYLAKEFGRNRIAVNNEGKSSYTS